MHVRKDRQTFWQPKQHDVQSLPPERTAIPPLPLPAPPAATALQALSSGVHVFWGTAGRGGGAAPSGNNRGTGLKRTEGRCFGSVNKQEQVRHLQLTEIVGWRYRMGRTTSGTFFALPDG